MIASTISRWVSRVAGVITGAIFVLLGSGLGVLVAIIVETDVCVGITRDGAAVGTCPHAARPKMEMKIRWARIFIFTDFRQRTLSQIH